MEEKIIDTKSCKNCQLDFFITDKDLEFYEKISPSFGGRKYLIPSPTLCPQCRQQRRLTWRNERALYRTKCDLTGKDIVSTYRPGSNYTVYSQSAWWSNEWDAMNYAQDYDSPTSFSEQFNQLLLNVPHIATVVLDSENCDYNTYCVNSKNCYLSQRIQGEDIYYTYLAIGDSKNCFDCFNVMSCENCYYCIDIQKSNKCLFLQDGNNCFDVLFGYDLESCQNCVGCVGLKNKQYYIFNKQYTKDKYKDYLSQLTVSEIKEHFYELRSSMIHKEDNNLNSENVFGNTIVNSKDIYYGFDVDSIDTGRYINNSEFGEYVMDADFNYYGSFNYELMSCMKGYHARFSISPNNETKNVIYCIFLNNCSDCFGCAGLKNKQYCILNKQYTKEEYEILVPKIIEKMERTGEWGEFFPSSLSPFGYNETVANEYFPLTKQQALEKGFNWSDYEAPFPKVEKIILASKLPEKIEDIPDDILNWAIECEITKKPFRIIKPELEFYRKHSLPISKRHPDQRHLDRMNLRNPRKLYKRQCDKCEKDIQTTYEPSRLETVYCEECYNNHVY